MVAVIGDLVIWCATRCVVSSVWRLYRELFRVCASLLRGSVRTRPLLILRLGFAACTRLRILPRLACGVTMTAHMCTVQSGKLNFEPILNQPRLTDLLHTSPTILALQQTYPTSPVTPCLPTLRTHLDPLWIFISRLLVHTYHASCMFCSCSAPARIVFELLKFVY